MLEKDGYSSFLSVPPLLYSFGPCGPLRSAWPFMELRGGAAKIRIMGIVKKLMELEIQGCLRYNNT
ncbi:hypothetical protein ANACOL_00736 [Anaerotruncus colihominis DSM 17241]|uniref:Uncharacterized protein n=1 Tax=Anaerotruncus colihominis DSM 17241 TaxID=445972 RepID=B0P7K1_9FIRM|nr:hypothetical protein ANACOL_00736 [Anaerotruncus colihominis DSM 17241]